MSTSATSGFMVMADSLTALLERALGAERGDTLYLTQLPDGDCRISARKPEAVEQLEVARKLMMRDRGLLRALADK